MIRNVKGSDQSSPTDMYFRREMEVVSIRKAKREGIFSKRRFHSCQVSSKLTYDQNYSSEDENQLNKRILIVDKDFQDPISKLIAMKYSRENLPKLAAHLQSPEILEILKGVIGVRKLLATADPPITQSFRIQIDEMLIKLAFHQSPQIQLESCWSLANLACGYDGECDILIDKGVIGCFLKAIQSENQFIIEQGVWGLGNLACDSIESRDKLLKAGLLSKLAEIIDRSEDKAMIELICWTIASLCKGRPLPEYRLIEVGIMLLCCMIVGRCIEEEEHIQYAIIAIASSCTEAYIQPESIISIFETNILTEVVLLIGRSSDSLKYACLKLIGNLAEAEISTADHLLQLNFLDCAVGLLKHNKASIRNSICWILSQIAASTEQNVTNFLLHDQLMERLIELLIQGDLMMKKDVIQIFANLSQNCGNFEVEEFYIESGIIDSIVDMLKEEDEKIVLRVLQNLHNILLRAELRNKEGVLENELRINNGVAILSRLRYSLSQDIFFETSKIVGRFFSTEEMDEVCV